MNRKIIICLGIIILMALSIFSFSHLSNASSQPVLSIIQSDTTNTYTIQTKSVNSTFSVDIRVDNTNSITAGINGATYTVCWDPTILSLTSASDNSTFWGSKLMATDLATNSSAFTFNQIIMDTSNASATSAQTYGVLATMTFKVIASGQSQIGFDQSGENLLYLTYPDPNSGTGSSNVPNVQYVNANYGNSVVYGPTAKIANQNGTTYTANQTILLDGSPSTPGYNTRTCNITSYLWSIHYQNNTLFGNFSGQTVHITPTLPAVLQVTLTVTAPDINNQPSPTYTNTSQTSIWINIAPAQQPIQQVVIDVFTDKGGIGPNASSPGFVPGELVQLYAYVTENGTPTPSPQQVVFTVLDPNGTIISITSTMTNSTGYAYQFYRTPWINGTSNFGIWSVIASVEVSQIYATDTVSFMYNSPVVTTQIVITVPASVTRGSSATVNVTIQSIDNSSNWSLISITIYDNQSVPVNTVLINTNGVSGITYSAQVTIPTWAFVGTATVYVNVLTKNPIYGGVPVCPEQTANFQID